MVKIFNWNNHLWLKEALIKASIEYANCTNNYNNYFYKLNNLKKYAIKIGFDIHEIRLLTEPIINLNPNYLSNLITLRNKSYNINKN